MVRNRHQEVVRIVRVYLACIAEACHGKFRSRGEFLFYGGVSESAVSFRVYGHGDMVAIPVDHMYEIAFFVNSVDECRINRVCPFLEFFKICGDFLRSAVGLQCFAFKSGNKVYFPVLVLHSYAYITRERSA